MLPSLQWRRDVTSQVGKLQDDQRQFFTNLHDWVKQGDSYNG